MARAALVSVWSASGAQQDRFDGVRPNWLANSMPFVDTGGIQHQRHRDMHAIRQGPQQQAGFKLAVFLPLKAGVMTDLSQGFAQQALTLGSVSTSRPSTVKRSPARVTSRGDIGLGRPLRSSTQVGGNAKQARLPDCEPPARYAGAAQLNSATLEIALPIVNQLIMTTLVAEIGAMAHTPGECGELTGPWTPHGKLVKYPWALKMRQACSMLNRQHCPQCRRRQVQKPARVIVDTAIFAARCSLAVRHQCDLANGLVGQFGHT